ncbi:MAG TPA: hypothetical protein VHS03_12945 [Gaiellaceae bacterium]|nr:hypothetical protein [Gaiellaceae bacterium]
MFRRALPRILALSGGLLVLTIVVSLLLGALAGSNLLRAVATGCYVVGVAILIGSFAMGIRGPLRAEWGEEGQRGLMPLPRGVRRASGEERVDSKRNSVGLFLLAMAFLLIGVGFDPARNLF